jgi:hypothetical protein
MPSLLQQRCLNHGLREAVARCPECAQHFCRECVAEHDGRLVCAGCLKRLAVGRTPRRVLLGAVFRVAAACAGGIALWLCFYGLGQLLLSVPSEFHEGSVWKVNFWDQEP